MSAATVMNVNLAEAPKTGELLRLENADIEDLRQCGHAAVERLRQALAAGATFTKDRKRKRFYEVHVDRERYYIHVLPGARKVLLLACWKMPEEA